MTVYFNGDYVDEASARVPVTDRGFLFGDGVFETLRVAGGRPLLWEAHWERLSRGAEVLGIRRVPSEAEVREGVLQVLRRNDLGLRDALVRITLTRGSGPRGYSPRGAERPTLVIMAQPAPAPFGGRVDGWKLVTSRYAVPSEPALASIKHANRLLNILARSEADAAGADEALMLSSTGQVAEASGCNVGWFVGSTLVTPAAGSGALDGVMMRFVRDQVWAAGWSCSEQLAGVEQLRLADGVFLTNSVQLLVPVVSLDNQPLRRSEKVALLGRILQDKLLSPGSWEG